MMTHSIFHDCKQSYFYHLSLNIRYKHVSSLSSLVYTPNCVTFKRLNCIIGWITSFANQQQNCSSQSVHDLTIDPHCYCKLQKL